MGEGTGPATALLYWEDSFRCALADAVVVGCWPMGESEGVFHVITDRTIFHPQGGGQPWDTGLLCGPNGVFVVNEVRKDGEQVVHIGSFKEGAFSAGDLVSMEVNEVSRVLHARLHSAGHLLDCAVKSLHLPLIPGKGYHFPNSPFVEYKGVIPPDQRESVKAQLNQGEKLHK